MRPGIKTWCDLHKRNADSLIKPSCGCRLCKELPKNPPINFSSILQEWGAEAEGGEAERGVWGCGAADPLLTRAPCRGTASPAQKRRLEGVTWGWGLGNRGAGGAGGEKQTACFNSCPFLRHLFCPRIRFPSEGVGFPGAPALPSRGCLLLRSGASFPVYKSACFWGEGRGGEKKMEYFRVHMEAKLVRENAVHLNFK